MRIDFDSAERGAMLRAAGGFVEAAASGREPWSQWAEDLAREEVFGVFTTLRRGGLLRSCIGHWSAVGGREGCLGELLRLSASHAASRDSRFPSIHPAELDFIELELSILFPPRRLAGGAEERLAAVVPGRHGLILEFRGRRGVLLPQVATERGWDAATFLDQICAKAGVPAGVWREPRAELQVFEALHFGEPSRRREIALDDVKAGIPDLLEEALRHPGRIPPRLEQNSFEFWTGILLGGERGLEFWIRERGTLADLVEDGLKRMARWEDGGAVRSVALLSHALPLRSTDDSQRRGLLGGSAIWVRAGGDRHWLREARERGSDPVPEALRAAGLNRSHWNEGQVEVLAFSVWPASGRQA